MDITLEQYKEDLKFQLGNLDDMDWDYFLETAEKARQEAILKGVNMNVVEGDVDEYPHSGVVSDTDEMALLRYPTNTNTHENIH